MKISVAKIAVLTLFIILTICSASFAEDVPDAPVKNDQATATGQEDPEAVDTKPSTPCQNACIEHAKSCNDHCKSLDDTSDQTACKKSCETIFNSETGYCETRCEHNSKFLTLCPQEEGTALLRGNDECLEGCEDHYGSCVMVCRDKFKEGDPKLKTCYQGCTTIFADNSGFCKSQCDLDPAFMQVCE